MAPGAAGRPPARGGHGQGSAEEPRPSRLSVKAVSETMTGVGPFPLPGSSL